jgi:ankyrin repeat protein
LESPIIKSSIDAQGNSPMHWAAKSGDVEMMKTLLHYGASLNSETSSETRMLPIHWAASDGRISSMRFFFANNVDVNCVDANGCTPVVIAVQHNQIPCAIFLIKNGVNMNIRDVNGDSATHWAAYKGYVEMLGALAYLCPQELLLADNYGQVLFTASTLYL